MDKSSIPAGSNDDQQTEHQPIEKSVDESEEGNEDRHEMHDDTKDDSDDEHMSETHVDDSDLTDEIDHSDEDSYSILESFESRGRQAGSSSEYQESEESEYASDYGEQFSYDRLSENSSMNDYRGNNRPTFRSFALPPFPPPLSNKPTTPDDIDTILDDLIKKQSETSPKLFSSQLKSHKAQAYDLVTWSIWNEKDDIALALIDKFGDSNNRILGRDPFQTPDDSPLHIAVELGNVNVIKKLLEKNANVNLKNPRNYVTPIKSALLRNRHDLVALFVDHLAQMPRSDLPFESDIKPLHYACMGTNLEHIRHFLALNPFHVNLPVDQTSSEELSGYTPLHLAAEFGNKKTVDFLLGRGAQLEKKARQSKTPLHVATDFLKYFRRKLGTDKLSEQADIVKSLLDHGSNVNAKNEIGATPLFSLLTSSLAFLKGDTVNYYLHPDNLAGLEDYLKMLQRDYDPFRIAQILLDHGAKTGRILPELVHAPYWGNYEKKLIKFLQSRGCDVDEKLRRKTLLWTLVARHRLLSREREAKAKEDMMRFLISCGASTECTYTERLLTPLHWAVRHGHPRVVELLLEGGANLNARTRKRRTPLHLATDKPSDPNVIVIMKILLNYCPDINLIDAHAKTAMEYFTERTLKFEEYERGVTEFHFPAHIIKYLMIGYYVDKINEVELEQFLIYYPELETSFPACKEEIEVLKKEKIDDLSTFYSILFKTPNQLAHKSNSVKFRKVAEFFSFNEDRLCRPAKYVNYGPFIKFLYQRGAKRFQRMQEAEKSLIELTKFEIPNLCCEEIFSWLNDEQLDDLKASTKYIQKKKN